MVTIHRILCPLDFSEFSRHALVRAAAIAKTHGAAITALHVVPMQLPFAPVPLDIGGSLPVRMTPAELARSRQALAEFARLDPATAVPIDCEVVEAPSIHQEIVSQAARLHVDLIVMGTHGRGGFQRLFLGSVAEKVLRQAVPPVMTVGAADSDDCGSFTRIVCGVDFSECSLAALDYALAVADGDGAHVTIVNVIEWTPVGYDPLIGPATDLAGYRMAAEASARERLRKAVANMPVADVQIHEIVTSGKPHHELLRIAEDERADLIVLGIHGRNPIDRLFFGSTAEPVVRRAGCPVLTVRARHALRMSKPDAVRDRAQAGVPQ